jgi:hypothetical protein
MISLGILQDRIVNAPIAIPHSRYQRGVTCWRSSCTTQAATARGACIAASQQLACPDLLFDIK